MRERWLGAGLAVLLMAGPADAITGICPDGSIFIVQSKDKIPCRNAKEVDSQDVPPVRPELLPRPYLWEVYRARNDVNNPYQLVDEAERVRQQRGGTPPPGVATGPERGAAPPPVASAPPPQTAMRSAAPSAPELGLTDGEMRDLFLLVELSQDDAPAEFLRETVRGEERFRVSLAHSAAFEQRVHGELPSSGPVLLFTALAKQSDTFHANLTFVQGHVAFSPETDDPSQLGILQGRLGQLDADELLLGYVVLPTSMDLTRPMDIYWNDRRLESVLLRR